VFFFFTDSTTSFSFAPPFFRWEGLSCLSFTRPISCATIRFLSCATVTPLISLLSPPSMLPSPTVTALLQCCLRECPGSTEKSPSPPDFESASPSKLLPAPRTVLLVPLGGFYACPGIVQARTFPPLFLNGWVIHFYATPVIQGCLNHSFQSSLIAISRFLASFFTVSKCKGSSLSFQS